MSKDVSSGKIELDPPLGANAEFLVSEKERWDTSVCPESWKLLLVGIRFEPEKALCCADCLLDAVPCCDGSLELEVFRPLSIDDTLLFAEIEVLCCFRLPGDRSDSDASSRVVALLYPFIAKILFFDPEDELG